jgi:hypothetical protein
LNIDVSFNLSAKFLLSDSVVDPYSFFPDPDPEFDVGDQYGSGSGFRIQYGSRALMTKNLKKITAENFFYFFLSKTAIYLSLGLH